MIQTDPIAFSPSIPLDSTEKLWEWHIPSDRLFFSKGTRLAFGLSDGESPATMAAFFEHIPEGCPVSYTHLWGRDSRLGTGGISGLEHTRAAALFCAGTGFYLRGSCLTPVFYLSLAPSALLFLLERGAFLCLSSVEIAQKGWQRLTENRKCSQMSAGAESAARFMLLLFRRLSW